METETVFKQVAVLEAGDSFGEYALQDRKGVRAARVAAIEPCAFGVLSAEDYTKSLLKMDMRHKSNMIDFLLSMPYFKSLSRISIKKHIIKMN